MTRTIDELRLAASTCTRCALASAGRTQVVTGAGPCPCKLMILGEAPGVSEDASGAPYAGRSGLILDDLLALVRLRRSDVYVANVLMCRPPGNRAPDIDEIESCSAWLFEQILLVRPHVLVTLGGFSTKLFSTKPRSIARLHGVAQEIRVADHRLWLYPLFAPWCGSGGMKPRLDRAVRRLPELLERDLSEQPGLAPAPAVQIGLFGTGAYGGAT